MKAFFERFGKFLMRWDGFWSVPAAIILFVVVGLIGQDLFGRGFGFYDPAFWQAGFIASGLVILFNFATMIGIKFNFTTVFEYYTNQFKNEFPTLKPWQKISIMFGLYCFYMLAMVLLYMKLA